MVQQIKNTKSEKQLTKYDCAYIAYASSLNLFHTNTMFYPWPFGIYYVVNFGYVKRINENSYQFQRSWGSISSNSPSSMNCSCASISTKTRNEIETIHKDLICNKDGDKRILIECYYRKTGAFNKNKLGFFLIEPKTKRCWDSTQNNLFIYSLVVTPKPGLFPGKNE